MVKLGVASVLSIGLTMATSLRLVCLSVWRLNAAIGPVDAHDAGTH